MNEDLIKVEIPYLQENAPYSLFCYCTNNSKLTYKENTIEYGIKPDTFFCLFYKFEKYYAAYIVTGAKNNTNAKSLPGINQKVSVIYKTDYYTRVKRLDKAIKLLTYFDKNKIYSFPLFFWYKLGNHISMNKCQKTELSTLYNYYKRINYDNN